MPSQETGRISSLALSFEEFQQTGHAVVDLATRILQSVPDGLVYRRVPYEIRQALQLVRDYYIAVIGRDTGKSYCGQSPILSLGQTLVTPHFSYGDYGIQASASESKV